MQGDKGHLRERFNTLSQRVENYEKRPLYDHQRVQAMIKEGDLEEIRAELEQCKEDVKNGKKYRNLDILLLDTYIKLIEDGSHDQKGDR